MSICVRGRVWRRAARPALGLAWLAALVQAARADTVVLQNGQTMEGLITEETKAVVTLSVGVGDVQLKRGQIKRIDRSTPEDRARLLTEWRVKYFAHEKFAPPVFGDLAARYRGLEGQRHGAVESRKKLEELKREQESTQRAMEALGAESLAVHARIKSARLPDSSSDREAIAAYNALISRNNAISSESALLGDRLAQIGKQAENERRAIAEYLDQLASFQARVASATDAAGTNALAEAERDFLAEIQRRAEAYAHELHRVEIPYEPQGEHAVLDAKLNDALTVKLLLDTGASMVVISETTAKLLKINLADRKKVPLTLANGAQVQGTPVVLESVEVNHARASNVRAVILSAPPAPGIDGLLGMSFLRNFMVRFDAKNGRMELVEFEPR